MSLWMIFAGTINSIYLWLNAWSHLQTKETNRVFPEAPFPWLPLSFSHSVHPASSRSSVPKSCPSGDPTDFSARLPCPPLSPGICSSSCPLSQWCHPTILSSVVPCPLLLLLLSVFPSISVFPNELVLHTRWPKYWSFSFSITIQIKVHIILNFPFLSETYDFQFWTFSRKSCFHSYVHHPSADTCYFSYRLFRSSLKMALHSSLFIPEGSSTWPGHVTPLCKDLRHYLWFIYTRSHSFPNLWFQATHYLTPT